MIRLKGDYFNDDWVSDEVKPVATEDKLGKKINSWTIVNFVGPAKNIYQVRCDCGNEFVRNIYPIVSGRSQRCSRCNIKSKRFFLI